MIEFFLAAAISFTAADARLAHATAAGLVENCTPRDAGTPEGLKAARWIRAAAAEEGVDARLDPFRAMTPDGERDFANVVAEIPSARTNAPWVVFISHFDTAPAVKRPFEGANDGASTTGLMVALAAAVRRAGAVGVNVAFEWTDAEECRVRYGPDDGFQGARHAAARFRAQGRRVKAAIGLDMLGDRDLHVTVPPNGDAALKEAVFRAAKAAGLAPLVSAGRYGVLDDFVAFHEAGFPAVDLIDFEYGSAPGKNDYWHTPADTMDKVSAESLEKAGRLAAAILDALKEK